MNKILYIYILLCANILFADIGVQKIAGGFDKPVYVLSVPGSSNEIIVLEQKGAARLVRDGKVTKTPFLNITDRVHTPLFPGDEMGFLGFAFDPNYIDNQYFYVHYDDKDDNTIISRFRVNGKLADKKSEKIILTLAQPYSNHNGGTIEFRKDGFLYIGLGDGGSSGDPENRAQDPSNLFGSILRIDVKETITKEIVGSDSATSKYNVSHTIGYKLIRANKKCSFLEKKITTTANYDSKSAGYNFGTDISKTRTIENNILDNIESFLKTVSSLSNTESCNNED